ncbi:MAG: hypothetical protein E7Z76_06810 [Methanobrevibacter sp.]|nr:hypothetical protein [Methanobrevibacter sp.]
MTKRLVLNNEFIDDIDDKFIDEFVNVPSGIPSLLMNNLEKIDSDIGMKRMLVFEKHPEYESLDRIERINTKKLLTDNKLDEAQEYHIYYALRFLEKYPKFKHLIKNNEDNNIKIINPISKNYNSLETMISKE